MLKEVDGLHFVEEAEAGLEDLPDIEDPYSFEEAGRYVQNPEKVGKEELALDMAYAIGEGFRLHDQNDPEKALKCFAYVDTNQFHHLEPEEAVEAAHHYNEALRLKDQIEKDNLKPEFDGLSVEEIDPQHIEGESLYQDPRWTLEDAESIKNHFYQRANIAASEREWTEEMKEEISNKYADDYTTFWRKHKLTSEEVEDLNLINSNNYVEELVESMNAMVKIISKERNPQKNNSSDPGKLPPLYTAGAEAHDKDEWHDIPKIMQLYYSSLLEMHE